MSSEPKSTTTRAINLPDETWAWLERRAAGAKVTVDVYLRLHLAATNGEVEQQLERFSVISGAPFQPVDPSLLDAVTRPVFNREFFEALNGRPYEAPTIPAGLGPEDNLYER